MELKVIEAESFIFRLIKAIMDVQGTQTYRYQVLIDVHEHNSSGSHKSFIWGRIRCFIAQLSSKRR